MPAASQPHDPVTRCGGHLITAKQARPFIGSVWDKARWGRGAPSRKVSRAWGHKLHCAVSVSHRRAMKRQWKTARKSYGVYRAYRLIAPFKGFRGEGYWLRWLPIPRYIVACETRGYYGEGRWGVINSIGAGGPAQLLGHGQPQPAMSSAERLTYWRITRDLYVSEGATPWECA